MKTTCPLLVLAAALFCSFPAFAQPIGPVKINVRAISQNLNYHLIEAKTNLVETNSSYVLKSTTTDFTVNANWLLALLTNSFHTNFPAGSKLVAEDEEGLSGFLVTDSTGTNFSFDPSKVLWVTNAETGAGSGFTLSGIATETSSVDSPFASRPISGNDRESIIQTYSIIYDDSAMTNMADGTHTVFSWTGLDQEKFSQNLASEFATYKTTISIIGSGSVRGQSNVIFTGTMRYIASGN